MLIPWRLGIRVADAALVAMYGTLLVGGLMYLVWMMVAEYTAWRAYHGSSNDSEDDGSLYDRGRDG